MKKKINTQTGIVWMACLMLGVAMAACSSDADEPENNDGRKLRQLTITDVPMTRATLTDNGNTLGASWKAGDKATYFNLSSFTQTNIDSDVLTALLLLSYVMYLRHYKLDEPEYDRICAELKERRAYKKSV